MSPGKVPNVAAPGAPHEYHQAVHIWRHRQWSGQADMAITTGSGLVILPTSEAIYAYVSAMSAIIIPVRAFKSTAEMDAFHAVLTERNTAAGKLL